MARRSNAPSNLVCSSRSPRSNAPRGQAWRPEETSLPKIVSSLRRSTHGCAEPHAAQHIITADEIMIKRGTNMEQQQSDGQISHQNMRRCEGLRVMHFVSPEQTVEEGKVWPLKQSEIHGRGASG